MKKFYKRGVNQISLREHLLKKGMFSFGHCPNYPSPSFGQLVHLFRPSKINIYIVFFNSGKGLPPPSFGQCPKENIFLGGRCSLTLCTIFCYKLCKCGCQNMGTYLHFYYKNNNIHTFCLENDIYVHFFCENHNICALLSDKNKEFKNDCSDSAPRHLLGIF